MQVYSQEDILNKYIGKKGTSEREQFEFELQMDVLGSMIRNIRKKRRMTQAQLGELIGVRKAEISKLERSARNMTIATVLKVFGALGATVNFSISLADGPQATPAEVRQASGA